MILHLPKCSSQCLTSTLLENFAGRNDHTQVCVSRPSGFTFILLKTLCPPTCAGKQKQDRDKQKNARVHTIGKASFPSHCFYSLPSCLPTMLLCFSFPTEAVYSIPPSLGLLFPHKALCSRLQNTDPRNRKFSQLRDATFQMHNHSLTTTPKACGINLQRKFILQEQGS